MASLQPRAPAVKAEIPNKMENVRSPPGSVTTQWPLAWRQRSASLALMKSDFLLIGNTCPTERWTWL